MKSLLFILLLVNICFSESYHELSLKISDVDCNHCVQLIKTSVLENEMVATLNFDLDSHVLTVFSDEQISTSSIVDLITAQGYGVSVISSNNVQVNVQQIVVKVDGIVCSFCIIGIQKNFEKLPMVSSARFNLETGELLIDLLPNTVLDDDLIKSIFKDADYNVKSIDRF